MQRRIPLIVVFIIMLLSGCRLYSLIASPTPDQLSASVAIPASSTIALPADLPTQTQPPQPSPQVPLSTVQQMLPSPTPQELTLKIFLIAVDDKGVAGKLVGCGDSSVPVDIVVPYTKGVLRAALEYLLSLRESYYGQSGLYNALYQSDLQIEDVRIVNGEAIIHLVGQLVLGGVCDNPRVEAQLKETALQFPTVTKVSIFINGKPLEEVLSLR